MTTHDHTTDRRRVSPAAILLVPVVVALVLTLFAWPSARLEPRDLPIGVVGQHELAAAPAGAFDVHRYADEGAAREAIQDRDVYGAFVAGDGGPKVLTAAAASPAVAQMLTHAAAEQGAPVAEVAPGTPHGAALASSVLPLVLAGILTGVVAVSLAAGGLARAGLVVVGSLLAGLTATGIVQSWLEVVEGDWFANAAGLSLTVLAIASVVAGLKARFGEAGLAAGALTMVLVGNPFSAVGSAPELLPEPVGGIGQLLPPGAGGNLLRSTGFFDGAAAGGHVAVLSAWALAGMAVLLSAALRARRPASERAGAIRAQGEVMRFEPELPSAPTVNETAPALRRAPCRLGSANSQGPLTEALRRGPSFVACPLHLLQTAPRSGVNASPPGRAASLGSAGGSSPARSRRSRSPGA